MSALPVLAPVPSSRLVCADGAELPLRACELRAVARAGIARVVVEQTFLNASDQALEVTYQLPLPADGAVAGFSFRLADRTVRGEIATREDARAQYEEALFEGRTAGLLEQDRSALFTQAVGNIPPRREVVVTVELDQPLVWAEQGWCWRFPTVVGPRYVDAGVQDAERLTLDVASGPLPARLSLSLEIGDALTGPVRSDTHAIVGGGVTSLVGGLARLDRDVVVSWPVAQPTPGVTLTCERLGASRFGSLVLVPPSVVRASVPRDVILLLDVSGSMAGEPLDMLRATCAAVVDGLGEQDTLEMISFAEQPARWRRAPMRCDARTRAEAQRWLRELRAGGSTEMDVAIRAALDGLREGAQRQIVLVTDGYIGFEDRVLSSARDRLPEGSRIHTVGVGVAPNRGLTRPLARVGRGQEILPTRLDLDAVVRRLCAHLAAPQVVDLTVDGDAVVGVAPSRLPDLYAGAPARLALELKPGTVRVRGRTAEGPWTHTLTVGDDADDGTQLARLFGRERVEDLECDGSPPHERDRAVEEAGLRFGIVTRRTSLVAISETPTVDPRAPSRRVLVPHELPAGTSVDGLGLRPMVVASPSTMASLASLAFDSGLFSLSTVEHRRAAPRRPSAAPPSPPEVARAQVFPSFRLHVTPPVPGATRRAHEGGDLRLVRAIRKGTSLLVILDVVHELVWIRPDAVLVRAGGAIHTVKIDLARSTESGELQVGNVLRLVLLGVDALGPIEAIGCAGTEVAMGGV